MPRLKVEVSHTLGQAEAVRRLKEKFELARGAYASQVSDLSEEWRENTFRFGLKAMGMRIEGTIEVTDTAVCSETSLPLAAMMFKSAIAERARQELAAILA